MRKAKKAIAITALTAVFLTSPAPAAAFVLVVYDPTNYANAVKRYLQLRKQLAQLQATYAQITNQYNLAVQMAKNIPNMGARYAASWAPWRFANAQDFYGNDTQWISGVNTGLVPTVLAGYQRATNTLQPYSRPQLATMPANERQRIESDSASVELTDGAAEDAMETIGGIRANALATTNTITNIQNDSLSNDPNLNTEVSVLNKVNATSVLALQNAQDTNKLLVAILEQNTVRAKELRDAQTDAMIQDINRRANTVPMNTQLEGGIENAIASFKLP